MKCPKCHKDTGEYNPYVGKICLWCGFEIKPAKDMPIIERNKYKKNYYLNKIKNKLRRQLKQKGDNDAD